MLRDFCNGLIVTKENQDVVKHRLSENEWTTVGEIVLILKEFAISTTTVQNEQISLSSFSGIWAKLIIHCKKNLSNQLAKSLLAAMCKRHDQLLNNPVMNAALYMDPRYQKYMTLEKKNHAINYLIALHHRIDALKNETIEETTAIYIPLDVEMDSVLLQFMNGSSVDEIQINRAHVHPNTTKTPEDIIRSFDGTEIPFNECIFEYWNKQQQTKPLLFELATLLHSVPPSQATVERAFSAFALILTHLRTRMSDHVLDDVLTIRLNPELFDEI